MSEQGGGSILHAVVHYPHLESEGLNRFRQKYDPFAELIREHLTLVFPIPVELQTIRAHVQATATEIQPFDIQIAGLKRTWDHWLYLGIEEGYEQIIALHDQLYSGPLRKHLRTDLPFEPHIGIGLRKSDRTLRLASHACFRNSFLQIVKLFHAFLANRKAVNKFVG